MSTPTKKRRLPEWVTFDLSPGSKEVKSTTDNRVVKAKEANTSCSSNCSKIQETRSGPSVNEETKAAGGASSSKTKDAKVSRIMGGFEDKNVKATPPIKEELDAITDTTGPKGKNIDVRSTGVKDEEFKIPGAITERKPSGEFQAKVKVEPEERVEGVYVINEKLDRRNIVSSNEESKDKKERRQLLSESTGKKSHNSLQNQNANSLDDVGRTCTPTAHHVKTNKSRFEQYRNGKLQQMSQNEVQTNGRHDGQVKVEEEDTGVVLATHNAEDENCKPLVRQFSKLLEGVIFSISGLVNPERTELRKMALDMGADYKPSWCNDCTLLIAAFHNTPAFNQVKAVDGTIVHKDWIVECYKRKELIAIEEYMMHVGNPWRAGQDMDESPLIGVEKDSPSQKEQVTAHKTGTASGDHQKLASTAEDGTKISMCNAPDTVKTKVTRVEIQHWFVEDLKAMRSWLEGQHEKPEQEILELTAAQGLVACLEDAIQSLEENQGLKLVLDAWAFVPKAIKELEKELSQVSRTERVVREAERIKSIYTTETQKMGLGDPAKEETQTDDDATEIISDTDSRDPADYNSDDTEDLDEDEITECQFQILRRFSLG